MPRTDTASWPGPKHAVRRYTESAEKSMAAMPYLEPRHLPFADQSLVKYRYVSLSAEPTASVCPSGDHATERIHCFESRAWVVHENKRKMRATVTPVVMNGTSSRVELLVRRHVSVQNLSIHTHTTHNVGVQHSPRG